MLSNSHIISRGDGLYSLASDSFLNEYYIISDEGTRRLMASPEVVGFDSYMAMVPPTVKALKVLKEMDSRHLDRAGILTILRGGLNYPVEESCHSAGILTPDISFMSCERIIRNGIITGLDVKYEQVRTEPDCALIIGDIIASGQTLDLCLRHVIERFRAAGHNIRKIIFFTVGGTKAIGLMENLTADIRSFWPAFEGFQCVFYEGIFTVYDDKGVTGINTPDIDFGWKGGAISPEFRDFVLRYDYAPALLEKCIIYDGGARRYQIDLHAEEVTEYWKDLLSVADRTDFSTFIAEKTGCSGVSYEEWLEINRYTPDDRLRSLYELETAYIGKLASASLRSICEKRLAQLEEDFGKYKL